MVQAFERGSDHIEPWPDPHTVASGLRVPAPIGGRLMLRALRESGGEARAVADAALLEAADRMTQMAGIDAGPEGGATLAALEALTEDGAIAASESVVIFNTGAGWLYRVGQPIQRLKSPAAVGRIARSRGWVTAGFLAETSQYRNRCCSFVKIARFVRRHAAVGNTAALIWFPCR